MSTWLAGTGPETSGTDQRDRPRQHRRPSGRTDLLLTGAKGLITHGRKILLLRAEVRWKDSPVFGLMQYRRGWPEAKITIESIEHQRNRYDVQMAEQGMALARGYAPRGRTPYGRPEELDRLARLGLKWVRVPGTGRSPEDLTWPVIAMTDGDRRAKKVQGQASKLAISIKDVRQRALEFERWGLQ